MQTENLIAADVFCTHHNIEISFINSLHLTGLIEILTIEDKVFIHADQLEQLERFTRFFYSLDINLEGIEAIMHLLHRVNAQQDEILSLRNRLRIYETNY